MNSPIDETFRPFTKNFKVTRMVIRACLGFLEPLKRRLVLSQQESMEFKYLKSKINDKHLAHGQLQDRNIARQEHKEKYDNNNYFNGNQEQKIINAIPNDQTPKLDMQELLCLKGTYCGEKLLEKQKYLDTTLHIRNNREN